MHITIRIKNVYGRPLYYPVCERSKLLARLSGKDTLTDSALATIRELGYEVRAAAQELPEVFKT